METGVYGQRIARYFRLADAASLAVRQEGALKIAVTHLRSDAGIEGRTTSPPRENAYSIHLHLRDNADHELWLRGKHVFSGSYKAGTTSLVHLDDEPMVRIGNPFSMLQVYVPHGSLDEVAFDHGAPSVGDLTWPRGASDPTAASFAGLLLGALADRGPNTLFVDHVMLALRIHIAQAYGGVQAARFRTAGGLAPWQERRAKGMMRDLFAAPLSIADLARECGLSPSHFTRAFRQSVGVQPHRWLSRVRIEAAKAMLAEGNLPLVEVALACGFGDQSYFTRMFTRAVGTSPGAWQRQNRG